MVIDTDGSAFITKAEFDSLKNNFQAQIDNYNSSIDSKIDGAIASYLAGIKLSSTCELIYDSFKAPGKEIYWKNDTSTKNTTPSSGSTYNLVEGFYTVLQATAHSYIDSSYTTNDARFGRAVGSYTTLDKQWAGVRWIRGADGYIYSGKVDGKLSSLAVYSFDYKPNTTNYINFAETPDWERFSLKCDFTTEIVICPNYYVDMVVAINNLTYPSVDSDLVMQPRLDQNDYIVDLVPNSSYKVAKGTSYDSNDLKLYWKANGGGEYKPGGATLGWIGVNPKRTVAQWLNIPYAIRDQKLLLMKNLIQEDWKMIEGIPIFKVDQNNAYTLKVIVPQTGHFYFYNRTKNKITDFDTTWTNIINKPAFEITGGVQMTITVDADQGDWLAVIYQPNTTTKQKITSMQLTKEN